MSLLDSIQTEKKALPRRIMLYGTHGIGKSTFGSMAPDPIFIQTEEGLDDIACHKFPLAESLADVMQALEALSMENHDYKTLVIDSADWLEKLIWQGVCEQHSKKNIEDFGYGKGYVFAVDVWREILEALNYLRKDRGMFIILIAHAQIEKFQNPETDAYDRYSPRLNKHASAVVQEWCDEVLFASYKVMTKQTDTGFGKKVAQGISDGERYIRTTERPAHVAKNRLNLPDEMPLDWNEYAKHLTQPEKRGVML